MRPTNKLRFVRRWPTRYALTGKPAVDDSHPLLVLQQLWEPEGTREIASKDPEWRDVPEISEEG